jgi:hypothetical protein
LTIRDLLKHIPMQSWPTPRGSQISKDIWKKASYYRSIACLLFRNTFTTRQSPQNRHTSRESEAIEMPVSILCGRI